MHTGSISCILRGSVLQAITSDLLYQPLELVVNLTQDIRLTTTRTVSSMLPEARFSICSRVKCAERTSEHNDG
jgi:hypothetical protein